MKPVLQKDFYRSVKPMVRRGDSQQAHYSFNMIISGMTQQYYFPTKMTIRFSTNLGPANSRLLSNMD
jgi:hypothetical protein